MNPAQLVFRVYSKHRAAVAPRLHFCGLRMLSSKSSAVTTTGGMSVIAAVVYTFFVESLLGNTPGTIKRVAVSYYVQCQIYGAGREVGVKPPEELQFLPIGASAASTTLTIISLALLAAGAWGFQRREFRDLD